MRHDVAFLAGAPRMDFCGDNWARPTRGMSPRSHVTGRWRRSRSNPYLESNAIPNKETLRLTSSYYG